MDWEQKEFDADTRLVPAVRVGEWSMPWNARDGVGRLGRGIPKWGIDHVGHVCIAQLFEFGHVGVIVGPDLVYPPMDGGWVGERDQAHDRVVCRGVTQGWLHQSARRHSRLVERNQDLPDGAARSVFRANVGTE